MQDVIDPDKWNGQGRYPINGFDIKADFAPAGLGRSDIEFVDSLAGWSILRPGERFSVYSECQSHLPFGKAKQCSTHRIRRLSGIQAYKT